MAGWFVFERLKYAFAFMNLLASLLSALKDFPMRLIISFITCLSTFWIIDVSTGDIGRG